MNLIRILCAGFLVLSAGACTGGSLGTPDVTPWVYDDDDAPSAEASPEDIAAAIEDGVAAALDLDVAAIRELYDSFRALGDGSCPAEVVDSDGYQTVAFWQDACATAAGAAFEGYSYVYDYTDYTDGNVTYNGWAMAQSAASAWGNTSYQSAGVFQALSGSIDMGASGELLFWYRSVDGSVRVEHPDAVGTWLNEGGSRPSLQVNTGRAPSLGDAHLVELQGGIGGLDGDLATVTFTGFDIFEAGLGSHCPEEPSGYVSVRDGRGEWYDVGFHGPSINDENLPGDPERCDGCGDVFFRGELIGEACPDLGFAFQAGEPW